jgi:hypothetical protein
MATASRGWVLIALVGGWLVGWSQPVELVVQPLFGSSPSLNGALPLRIELRNRSGNMQGVVSVVQNDFQRQREYLYPIELPAGARKQLIACPILTGYSTDVVVRFVARGVSVETRPNLTPRGEEDSLVVGIGDAIGGLQFLRTLKTRPRFRVGYTYTYGSPSGSKGTYEVAYCRPELFPPTAIACSGVSVMVLGAGAERMSGEQWQALLDWVRLGGTLIVPGGAGALYLQHPALRPLLPVQVQGLGELPSLAAIGTFAGQEAPLGKATVTMSQPAPGGEVLLQQGGVPLLVRRPYGLGAVLFMAFSPWDQPMRGYNGNPAFWQKLLEYVPDLPPSYYITTLFQFQTGSPPAMGWGWSPSMPASSAEFQVRLPETELILGLLLVYFVLVVPVNYFVLRRLRLLDWAWLTAPLIAVLFVLLLGRLTGDLYRKPLSGNIKTTLLLDAGSPNGYAINSILFFFPRAGLFDLRFENSEMVEAGVQEERFSAMGTPTRVSTIEREPKLVQGYRVRSLSLQWFRYTRPVSLSGTVVPNLRARWRGNSVHITGTLHSTLPYDLRSVQLMLGEDAVLLGDLPARGVLRVDATLWFRPAPRRPVRPQVYPPGYYVPPEEFITPSVQSLAQQWSRRWGTQPPSMLLVAKANEPVMAPELRDTFQSKAEITYLITVSPLSLPPGFGKR